MPRQVDVVEQDLNSVISSAVQARVEAEVLAALSGSEVIAEYVAAALSEKITIEDRSTFRKRETTYMAETLRKSIQEATKAAIGKVLAEQAPTIEAEVERVLKRNIKRISEQLTNGVVDRAKGPYGITVEMRWPNE